jgi:hypothetical protein
MLLDQSTGRNPVARITVNTPFPPETVDVRCKETPIYDLTIGNVEGYRLSAMADFKIPLAKAVKTRAQTRREKTAFHKLIVPESISGNFA